MCFSATSSFVAGTCAYGVAGYLFHRKNSRLKWCAVALGGITAMQWVEGLLWASGPQDCDLPNHIFTLALIPLALLAQVWGPLFGSLYVRPLRSRRVLFWGLFALSILLVVGARWTYQPECSQITPQGHLNWWSDQNPPHYPWPVYSLWAVVIGTSFLLWWRPFWQSLVIVSWGWLWALICYLYTDNAASNWCFMVSFYAFFVLVYALFLRDEVQSAA